MFFVGMDKNFAWHWLRRRGWTLVCSTPLPPKAVVCIAPHTSNWDFVYGMLFKRALRLKISFLMKKEWFAFPLGGLMRSLGGIPVDRSKHALLTDIIAGEFARRNEFYLAITPEGTRSLCCHWKRGFYFIAQKAQVPIVLGYIDYARKEVGYTRLFVPTGDVEADMAAIKNFYKTIGAKYPEKFGV